MSSLSDLLGQVRATNPDLAANLEREIKNRTRRQRQFGLVFEEHRPEAVELPSRPVRKGDKVRVLPPRGETKKGDQTLWRVQRMSRADGTAHLVEVDGEQETQAALADLVVVAEFRDHMYPGLVETGRVERGGDKPFHTVINAENFHALEMLTYTHRHSVDCIYIDPPYNSGAKDWKYNNDYVESDDDYRHSKWLSFMERRLQIARELLNPEDSVLIVTIDEKEVHRLALLLEQCFPDARIQSVSSVISSQASVRDGSFARCDETIFFVMMGDSSASRSEDDMLNEGLSNTKSQLWFQFVRTGSGNGRKDRKDMFFPIFIEPTSGRIHSVGDAIPLDMDRREVTCPEGTVAVWPLTTSGAEGRWRTGPEVARARAESGFLRMAKSPRKAGGWSAMSVNSGTIARIQSGEVVVESHDDTGAARLREVRGGNLRNPKTVWNKVSHNAGWHGSKLLAGLLPGRKFPFPKSLYAVEDTVRFFVKDKREAVILDFFSGSGTTAHAVMRLNRQDGGRRQCISVTNNEVSAEEQKGLRNKGLRPGDPEWEQWGICDYITKPRVTAAITGKTPDGDPIKGDYKFTDEFPMADGFEENAAFFTLTYESPLMVRQDLAFKRIAPLLWMRAGSRGRVITEVPAQGWDVAEAYGVLTKVDRAAPFAEAVAESGVSTAYVVTDDERRYQAVCALLPEDVTPVRLYESYLTNFEINTGGRTGA